MPLWQNKKRGLKKAFMKIYQPVNAPESETELKFLTSTLAERLLPDAMPLSEAAGSDPIHILLRGQSVLVEFHLYHRNLGEEIIGWILARAGELEMKRKDQGDPTLKEIGLCLLAHSFSTELLNRLPSDLVRLSLFQWSRIASDTEDAVLVDPIRKGLILRSENARMAPPVPVAAPVRPPEEVKPVPSFHEELSTPELIAFTRMSMELKKHRPKVS